MKTETETLSGYNLNFSKTAVSTRDLIHMVQKKPMLWDRHAKLYRDRIAKEKAWVDICTQIEPNFEMLAASAQEDVVARVTKKWYNVRDSYRKSLKHKGKERGKEYVYSEILTFLNPIYEAIDNKDHAEDVDKDSNDETSENFENVYLEFDEPTTPPTKRIKMEPKQEEAEESDSIVSVLANLIQREEDEDRAFFKSITPEVKKLSDESRFDFRIQVMQLIKNLRQKDKKRIATEKNDASSDNES